MANGELGSFYLNFDFLCMAFTMLRIVMLCGFHLHTLCHWLWDEKGRWTLLCRQWYGHNWVLLRDRPTWNFFSLLLYSFPYSTHYVSNDELYFVSLIIHNAHINKTEFFHEKRKEERNRKECWQRNLINS